MSQPGQLAEANIARMKGPLDSPVMEGFVARLEEINALADRSPGFVWRLQTEEGDATAIRAFDDELILFNLSVWETDDALFDFVYRSEHVVPFRDRQKWFEPIGRPHLVLWWVPVGHRPTVQEARDRLDGLQKKGPTRDGFTFETRFPPPGS